MSSGVVTLHSGVDSQPCRVLNAKALYLCSKNWNFCKALEVFHKFWQMFLEI